MSKIRLDCTYQIENLGHLVRLSIKDGANHFHILPGPLLDNDAYSPSEVSDIINSIGKLITVLELAAKDTNDNE